MTAARSPAVALNYSHPVKADDGHDRILVHHFRLFSCHTADVSLILPGPLVLSLRSSASVRQGPDKV